MENILANVNKAVEILNKKEIAIKLMDEYLDSTIKAIITGDKNLSQQILEDINV